MYIFRLLQGARAHEQNLKVGRALTCQPEAPSRADKQYCIQSFPALANLVASELMFSLQTGQCLNKQDLGQGHALCYTGC